MIESKQKHTSGALPVMNIRTRLTLWYSSLLATVIIVFGISLFSILNWTWKSQVDDNMLSVADQIAEGIIVNPIDGTLLVHSPDTLYIIPDYPFGIQIWQADGRLV